MNLHYCTICGTRVTETDLQQGDAVLSGEGRALCKKCFSDVSAAKNAVAPTPSKPAARVVKPTHASSISHPTMRAAHVTRKSGSAGLMWIGLAAAVALLIAAGTLIGAREPAKAPVTTAKPNVAVTPVAPQSSPAAVVAERKFQSSFKAVPLGTKGNKRGYWEFLPSAYFEKPTETFPVVVFFGGVPESGDGSAAQLEKMLRCGPPMILNDAKHPLNKMFEQQQAIVISFQGPPAPDWWHEVHITPVLEDVLNTYRVDKSRIYLTGLVAGALGLHELMDRNAPVAERAAAIWMACSQGGAGLLGQPPRAPEVASRVPYWALVNDVDSFETRVGVENIVAKMTGKEPANFMDGFPEKDRVRTALYSRQTGWTWKTGIPAPGSAHPIFTMVNATPAETWTLAYNSRECWDWLFAQRKK